MRKNKKIIVSVISVAVLVSNLLFPAFAQAFSFSIPTLGSVNINVNDILGEAANSSNLSNIASKTSADTEKRYGIDQDILRQAQRKVSSPRVEIFFDNTNPKPGEKVTAHATPEFFKNDPQNLYYTWYIIHTKDGSIKTATNSISDGKREASGIMARGDYDPNLDGQTYGSPDQDPDKDGWPAVDPNSYDENKVAAPMGGSDGVGGLAEGNDNIEPYANAGEYCDTKGKHGLTDCNLNTEKSSFSQYYNLKSDQSGDYCKSCQSSVRFTSNLFSSSGIIPPNNQCCYDILYPSPITDPADPACCTPAYDPAVNYCPSSYNVAYESCFDFAGLKNLNSNLITDCLTSQYSSCTADWDDIHSNPTGAEAVSKVSRCYKHNFGTNNPSSGFRGFSADTNSFSDDPSGIDSVVDCTHKWKDAPHYTSGSGKFPTGEEDYWKTDPTDPDTDGDGFSDEADVIGLGQQTFTWNYQPGDRLGVVVEGTSLLPTEEKTAYYKIMWGYLDVCDSTKAGLMDKDECEGSGDFGYGFLATRSPSESGDEKLKVSLTYSPEKPVADPSDANKPNIQTDGTISDADEISVSSSIDSTDNDPRDLYYTWQISKGSSASADDWTEIKDIKANFNTASASNGLGITDFNFTPKQSALSGSGDVAYFKVTLTVATAANVTQNRGRSSAIIAVNKNGIKIKLYKVDIKDGKAVLGKEVCSDGLYKTLCPAVQYQMLAAKVDGGRYQAGNSEFSWSLDGNPVSPPADSTNLFDGWSNTAVFFPITKEEQAIQQISVTATPKDALQPVTGSRAVTVMKPALFIKSSDSSASWPETYTVSDPDKKYGVQDVESDTNYQALTNKELSYYVSFVPDYLIADDSLNTLIDWQINGASMSTENVSESAPGLTNITLENNNQTIKFATDDQENQSYTLGAKITKYWSDEEKNILSSAWSISPATLDGDTSLTITTTAPSDDGVQGAMGNPQQILAAIGTHLPHYSMYILRLALTLLVMFFLSAGFYALSSKMEL